MSVDTQTLLTAMPQVVRILRDRLPHWEQEDIVKLAGEILEAVRGHAPEVE
ncbi:MAG: hypothetical protein GTO63_15515 [Anaerolineae bacterium]|nr:hypothetical protein [Anaerolineae bacterium]NIN96237.1 hypothetical protein [Anaerolineae bacterium]NIQ79257.1 hypothetical protein [Anaerolineae bacterium]